MTGTNSSFKLKKRRYFSETFKREKVSEIKSRKITISELSSLYDIKKQLIYTWLKKYAPEVEPGVKISYEMETEAQKTLYYKERVAELERLLGRKQVEVEFLEQLISIASENLELDIKKNFSTELSSGSESIKQRKR